MPKTFRPYEPDQMLLIPPSPADWVPEDDLARFISDVVDTLDLSAIEAVYDEEQAEVALRQEVAELLRRAEVADRDEDARYGAAHRGDELPAVNSARRL